MSAYLDAIRRGDYEVSCLPCGQCDRCTSWSALRAERDSLRAAVDSLRAAAYNGAETNLTQWTATALLDADVAAALAR